MRTGIYSLFFLFLFSFSSCRYSELDEDYNELFDMIESSETTTHAISFDTMKAVNTQEISPNCTTEDLYGIQVYFKPNLQEAEYKPYAYGLFNDTQDLQIKLLENYLYKVVCTRIVNGVEKVAHDAESNAYWNPFITLTATPLNNKFQYSTKAEMKDLGKSQTMLIDENNQHKLYNTPNVDRYYGELNDFQPSWTETTITLKLNRVACDVLFVLEGDDADAQFKIWIDGTPIPYSPQIEQGYIIVRNVITLPEDRTQKHLWDDTEYKKTLNTVLSWQSDQQEERNYSENKTYSRKQENNIIFYAY